MAQWPFKGKFDVIFCRNVVIYFDEPTQMKIWSALCRPAAGRRPSLYRPFRARLRATPRTVFDNIGITTYRYTARAREEAHERTGTRSRRRRFRHHARPDHGRAELPIPMSRSSARPATRMEAREAIKELESRRRHARHRDAEHERARFSREDHAAAADAGDHGLDADAHAAPKPRSRRWKSAPSIASASRCRAMPRPFGDLADKVKAAARVAAQVIIAGDKAAAPAPPTPMPSPITASAARSSRSAPRPAASRR